MSTGVMILAAGAATRMGKAKMLLPYQSVNILQHIVNEIQQIQPQSVLIVTGCYHQLIMEQMKEQQAVKLVYNEKWPTGMASSIQAGVQWILQQPIPVSQLFLLVSDQPYLNAQLLQDMLQLQQQTKKGMIAATYEGIAGTPVLFSQAYFIELLKLQGDKGARSLLKQYREDVATISFPMGKFDIDTPEDYQQFCLQNQTNNAN
ncbi:nucleotidyltransferase family protein [Hydrotalea sp.]|uniref:nucleotidyltransferase family protein n=1 Tax=Hydrotalea sp. TaxID=2881279 RepID=UPI0026059F81|nr:nucleotidyltransferase family protein [Hydrotalea sp.]